MERRDPSPVGELLRQHRIAAALSQEALAERAGLSVRAISDLERGIHQVPRLETVRLLADALGLDAADRAALLAAAHPEPVDTRAIASDGRVARPLPVPPTRLIGRETEVAAIVRSSVDDDVRLVTLTGAGGTGKTRLALAVAAEVQRPLSGWRRLRRSLTTDRSRARRSDHHHRVARARGWRGTARADAQPRAARAADAAGAG